MRNKEEEPRELEESALEKVARELLERKDKGDIVIGGAVKYYPFAGGEHVIIAVSPSLPLYDPEVINRFTRELVKSMPPTRINPFNSDRGNTYIGSLIFHEIKGTRMTTSTDIDALRPIERQLMQQVGIGLPEETQSEYIESIEELSRFTRVNVYPHPKLAEIAGDHMKKGYTNLFVEHFPTKSFKKIRRNELKGRPFPVEDFQLPKQKGK